MKCNLNKILLEAINRGIKFALDDFDDNELIGQLTLTIKDTNHTKEYLDLMKEVVDLGLPSGTLWCKHNLGVNPNQLSKPEDWYGKYYAWGELEGNKTNEDDKIIFHWNNYKFGYYDELTKYCNDPRYGLNGFTDNLTLLLPEDDAAYQNKHIGNFKFHIPTKEQCEELINYTTNYWVNNYDPNNMIHHTNDDGIRGLNGRVFVGKNEKLLFIPAAGYRDSTIFDTHGICYLWSLSLNLGNTSSAYYLYFNTDHIRMYSSGRYYGYSVRPVINL